MTPPALQPGGADRASDRLPTDASEVGGSVDVAEAVAATGIDFLQTCEKIERGPGKGHRALLFC